MKEPTKKLQHLGVFWQHFWIHKRKSDFSWKDIVSVFPLNCPYPVWHHSEWIENSNPVSATYDEKIDFWTQVWELFQKCPIAHNISFWNENCEYTDDSWYSKNCYLSHSFLNCEDIRYSYRVVRLKDCYFCVFSFDSSLCIDLIYWFDCYNVKNAIDVKRCKNSAFLFDCQDCEDCLLCWNLRNKRYCIANKEYSQADYEKEIKKYNLNSKKVYETLKIQFSNFIKNNAWWKAIHFDNIENSSWDYLENCKDCENCFSIQNSESNKNVVRAYNITNNEYWFWNMDSENVYFSVMIQDNCYNIKYSSNIIRSKNIEYCINCQECEDCFLCASLVWKKYHILNKEYKKNDYEIEKNRIIEDMKKKWNYEEFFPAYFSPTWYDESISSIYIPLNLEEQKKQWFRVTQNSYWEKWNFSDIKDLPDNLFETNISKLQETWFWDEDYKRPFQILKDDIEFYKKLWVPINDKFYIRRIRENFAWMFPNLELRETICAKSWENISTTLPKQLDWRIVSLKEYEKLIY